METTQTLNSNRDFRRLYAKGRSFAGSLLVVYALPNNKKYNRLGITVNKKLGKAVRRNRARRLIKEAYRLNEDRIKKGYDIVIVARHKAVSSCCKEVSRTLLDVCATMHLLG